MIKLIKPEFNQYEIITDCTSQMRDDDRKQLILNCRDEIVSASEEYDRKASAGQLSLISVHDRLLGGASKDDMTKLYEQRFASKRAYGRVYYDKIKLLSPNFRCPYCAQRGVGTLDHYLPKSKYPVYAVTPYNLVPACMECNKVKMDENFGRREEEVIHPYYDDFSGEKWVAANMIEEEPIAFEFFVRCPECWDHTKKRRAENHFYRFQLGTLYKPYASEEFGACYSRIKRLYLKGGKDLAVKDLNEQIIDRDTIRLNTWQAAMYQAIIDSQWFWETYLPQNT
ncbi:MAG: hypothetical protein IJ716_12250 [Lachnospiraceae bacterium]|nr:hypothetical protein [Lachnospiraceae bacterium]